MNYDYWPHNRCKVHNRRNPRTGRCMECARLKAIRFRRTKSQHRSAGFQPAVTQQINCALREWR